MTFARLLSYLDGWGTSAVQSRDGSIRVEFVDRAGKSKVVHVVMTPEEWDGVLTVWGDPDDAARGVVIEPLLALERTRERYLVFHQYELHPSMTPQLPPKADLD